MALQCRAVFIGQIYGRHCSVGLYVGQIYGMALQYRAVCRTDVRQRDVTQCLL